MHTIAATSRLIIANLLDKITYLVLILIVLFYILRATVRSCLKDDKVKQELKKLKKGG